MPFQDAVLFDMLLDLVIGSFKPHERKIEDAVGIHLEMIEALERELKALDATTAAKIAKSESEHTRGLAVS